MAESTDKSQTPKLGLVAQVKLPKRRFRSRSFRCPPGFIYSLFRQSSAGPEFIESFGPNESGKVGNEEELYRIPIGGASHRYHYREPYTLVDGTVIELDIELFVTVTDGAKVTRLIIQDRDDPLVRLRGDIRWLLSKELGQRNYNQIFLPERKEIQLETLRYGEKVKQQARSGNYGLETTEVRIALYLPPELKKRWQEDIARWQEAEAKNLDIAKQRQQIQQNRDTSQLDVQGARIDADRDQQLASIQQEKQDQQRQREWTREDDERERELQKRRKEEEERQSDILGEIDHEAEAEARRQRAELTARQKEAQHDIEIDNFQTEASIGRREKEHEAELGEQQKTSDFERKQEAIRQREELRLEAERKAHEHQLQVEALRHQVSTDSLMVQVEDARRKREELDKIHNLRLLQVEKETQLRIEKIEAHQTRLLTSGEQEADLSHKRKLLEYHREELELDIKIEQLRHRNEITRQAGLDRLELNKMLVDTRLAMLDRISRGEVDLKPAQIDKLLGIDPMTEREMTPERIGNFVQVLKVYLEQGGTEELRDALLPLVAPDQPALPDGEATSDERVVVESESSTEEN